MFLCRNTNLPIVISTFPFSLSWGFFHNNNNKTNILLNRNTVSPSSLQLVIGRVIRRAVKRRHAHPLVSRLEKDYLNSPPFHRSSPNLYQPDSGVVVVPGVFLSLPSGCWALSLSSFFINTPITKRKTFTNLTLVI